jgi:hypothetical protein
MLPTLQILATFWLSVYIFTNLLDKQRDKDCKMMKIMPSKLISPIQSKPERIVFADASSFAGAGFVELNGKHTVVHSIGEMSFEGMERQF